jgi:hypothetical protein
VGLMVSGRCGCGYAAEGLAVGVGMRNTPGVWLSPCLCRNCHQAVSANVLAKTLKCPTCKGKEITPFVDPDSGKDEDEAFPDCRASEPLFEGRFDCPACGKKTLRFSFSGMWD